jgi:hypothetical protein
MVQQQPLPYELAHFWQLVPVSDQPSEHFFQHTGPTP